MHGFIDALVTQVEDRPHPPGNGVPELLRGDFAEHWDWRMGGGRGGGRENGLLQQWRTIILNDSPSQFFSEERQV